MATCGAAHGQNELGESVGSSREGVGTRGVAVGTMRGSGSGYKTQPCRNMKDTGHCSYGSACQFAHSYQEMSAATAFGGGQGASSVRGQGVSGGGHGPSGAGGHGASA